MNTAALLVKPGPGARRWKEVAANGSAHCPGASTGTLPVLQHRNTGNLPGKDIGYKELRRGGKKAFVKINNRLQIFLMSQGVMLFMCLSDRMQECGLSKYHIGQTLASLPNDAKT